MTTMFQSSHTLHLPTHPLDTPVARQPAMRKGLRLTDLHPGETARVLRVNLPDSACRKRFAELGLAEGMKVTVAATGNTLMLILGGSRMGIAARCADDILVSRIAAARSPLASTL
jgi:Fe2+ transport system protein FeoA